MQKPLEHIGWPSIHSYQNEGLAEFLNVLEHTQFESPESILNNQLQQISGLLRYAHTNVPFYSELYRGFENELNNPLTYETLQKLPILSRTQIKKAGQSLLSQAIPKSHGMVLKGITTGSTGMPLEYFGTRLNQFLWNALTLREHQWHKRDYAKKMAVIRVGLKRGAQPNWGMPTRFLYKTGPSVSLNIKTDINEQIQWLLQEQPAYILSFPSNIQALARICLEKGIKIKNLREIRTVSEALNPDLRDLCQQAFGVPLVDIYSACETGYLALQCPEHNHYHIQSETVLVEILDDQDKPCLPGQSGRVVVTTLHNFAMPFIRYELMDYATVGEPCPCGRGLPVINNILGRQRNLVTLPDGRRYWPLIGYHTWIGLAPIEQVQIIQKSLNSVEAKLVMPRPFTNDEKTKFIQILQDALGHPFAIDITYHEHIPRSPGGKYEDFVSEVG